MYDFLIKPVLNLSRQVFSCKSKFNMVIMCLYMKILPFLVVKKIEVQ